MRRIPFGEALARTPSWLRIVAGVLGIATLGALTGVAVGALLSPAGPARAPGTVFPSRSAVDTATSQTAAPAEPSSETIGTAEPPAPPAPTTEMVGFYVNWDEAAYRSLEQHIDEITILMPMWYHLGNDGHLTVEDPAKQARALALIAEKRPDLKVMPIVNNYDQPSQKWNAPQISALLAKPAERRRMAVEIVDTLSAAGFEGVNIDFEEFKEPDRANLVAFMAELYPLAHAKGLEVSQDVLVNSKTYDHASLAKHVDYLIPMIYGEHWRTSGPGPVASQQWFEKMLGQFLAQVPPDKVVVGLGVYGRDWGTKGPPGSMTYPEAVAEARAHGALMRFDPATLNTTYTFMDGSDKREAWVLDALSVFDQVAAASKRSPRGYAIWRMGAEDPDSWKVFRRRDSLDADVANSLANAKRRITYDPARGLIVAGTLSP